MKISFLGGKKEIFKSYPVISILSLLFLIIWIISLLNMHYGYKLILYIGDEGKRINLAGQLRYKTYKLLWLANKIYLEEDILRRKKFKEEFLKGIDEVEKGITILEKGKKEYSLNPLMYKPSIYFHKKISQDWSSKIKPLFISFIGYSVKNQNEIIKRLNSAIPLFVEQINLFVNSLVEGYEKQIKKDYEFKVFSLIATLAVFIITIYFALVYLFNPLKKLMIGLKSISEGNFDAKIEVKRKDEIGKIAKIFNDMAYSLKLIWKQNQEFLNQIQQEKEFANHILDNIEAIIVILDKEGKIIRLNDYGARLSGYSFEEIRDKFFYDIFCLSNEREDLMNNLKKAAKEGITIYQESNLETKNGSRLIIAWLTTIIKGEGGLIKYIVEAGIDITKRKQLEKELTDYAQNLEKLIEERTKELQNALSKCEYVSKSKSEFLANMSHEIRNPLNSIIGFSEMLEEELQEILKENQKEYIRNIQFSSQHILQLLNDILDLAKVESGKMELEFSKFSLKQHIYSCISLFKEKALKKSIDLSYNIEPSADIEILADERKIKQILINLLSNAIKFTPEGGRILLNAKVIHKAALNEKYIKILEPEYHKLWSGNYIEISIKDTGIGIKKEDFPKLFKEFSQVAPSHKGNYAGSGLGLALTKKLVELHKGSIWFESEYGKGSEFIFVIPLFKERQAAV